MFFLSNSRPRSVNAKNTEIFKQDIQEAFKEYNFSANQLEGNLYGIVYYFHRIPTQIDADNISKPIWDALNTIAYSDDKNIKLRIAGVFDLNSVPIEEIDTSQMSDSVIVDFLKMTNENAREKHIMNW
jgi:Holliday junction resolvase RusA-like endonuclease